MPLNIPIVISQYSPHVISPNRCRGFPGWVVRHTATVLFIVTAAGEALVSQGEHSWVFTCAWVDPPSEPLRMFLGLFIWNFQVGTISRWAPVLLGYFPSPFFHFWKTLLNKCFRYACIKLYTTLVVNLALKWSVVQSSSAQFCSVRFVWLVSTQSFGLQSDKH